MHIRLFSLPRGKSLGTRLRWRTVYQRMGLGFTFDRRGRNLNISVSTAHHIYSLFLKTGNIDAAAQPTRQHCWALNESEELCVTDLTVSNILGEVLNIFSEVHCSHRCMRLMVRVINRHSYWIHHTDEVRVVAQQAGILLFFLSAYSTDLNPTEEALFSSESTMSLYKLYLTK